MDVGCFNSFSPKSAYTNVKNTVSHTAVSSTRSNSQSSNSKSSTGNLAATVSISQAARQAYAETANVGSNKSTNSDSSLPSGVQEDIKYLQNLYKATDDTKSRNEIHAVADQLRQIGANGDNYDMIRINTFIPMDKVNTPVPLSSNTFHGDGRSFDVDTTKSRTSQVIVVDLDKQKVTSANSCGETIEYDKNGKVVNRKRENTDGMSVESQSVQGMILLNAETHASNPLVKVAPDIDYSVQIAVSHDGTCYVDGDHDKFPAFEMYAKKNNGPYQTITQFTPKTDTFYNPAMQLVTPVFGQVHFSGNYNPNVRIL